MSKVSFRSVDHLSCWSASRFRSASVATPPTSAGVVLRPSTRVDLTNVWLVRLNGRAELVAAHASLIGLSAARRAGRQLLPRGTAEPDASHEPMPAPGMGASGHHRRGKTPCRQDGQQAGGSCTTQK
jgi:hypothetical protein